MKGWIGKLHFYGCLDEESAESIAPLVVNALSTSNYTRMVLIVDERKRVLLVRQSSKVCLRIQQETPQRVGPVYRCGRNPARFGLTEKRIANDIRETAEAGEA